MTQDSSAERRELLKNAFGAIEELKAKVRSLEAAASEPIAIVGAGCRFPGGANNLDAYWSLLDAGKDVVAPIPASRWEAVGVTDADPSWAAGIVDDIDQFDPRFFGISAREATTMDPQQRMVLEVAWEALENAGQAPDQLVGTRTGVFVGVTAKDYVDLINEAGGPLDVYVATGNANNAVAGRLSFLLGLQGPCASIDTACSSSLVAVHLACQSLRANECRMAIAGGVNALLAPGPFVCFRSWGMVSSDGHCKTFDARADGFVRGEGCGLIVLKRLSDARADGDRVLAVIRGSAVNNDGRSSGLTVPNGPAQEAVIRQALAVGRVDPLDVGYVEAHGTGTALGDPIEAHALAVALGAGRGSDNPLVVGSVKTNIGHLESAAGVAGLLKVVLSLQHGRIPRHLHFHDMNPNIDWAGVPVEIPVGGRSWERGPRARIAGVNSFGFSGTNAHVVLEEAPAAPAAPAEAAQGDGRALHLLTLSGRTVEARDALAARFARAVREGDAALGDICYTANTGRAHFGERAAVLAASREELLDKLASRSWLEGQAKPGGRRVAFLFTGQGAQWAGMARELDAAEPAFRAALDACAAVLDPLLGRPLRAVLWGADAGRLDETAFTQPALVAVEWALAALWRSWGVEPAAVLGHSVGEYAALCVAGAWALEDGLRLIAARGRLMQALQPGWGMTSIQAGRPQVDAALAGLGPAVSVAAVNAPESVVISGRLAELTEAEARLAASGIEVRRLRVSHGFHSAQMDAVADAFAQLVEQVPMRAPRVAVISSVTGRRVGLDELRQPEYWRRQVRDPVEFRTGMETLAAAGYEAFVEVGPAPTLTGLGRQCVEQNGQLWVASMRRDRPASAEMLAGLAQLYVHGAAVNWAGFDAPFPRRRVALPTYPFQRSRYWVDDSPAPARRSAHAHPLLGDRVSVAGPAGMDVWDAPLSVAAQPFLGDHRVQGRVIVPMTAYVEILAAAAGTPTIENLTLREPLEIADGAATDVQLQRRGATLELYRRDDSGWTLVATAETGAGDAATTAPETLAALKARIVDEVRPDEFYRTIAARGVDFGPTFRGLVRLTSSPGEALGLVELPEAIARDRARYRFHPAQLDACVQAIAAALGDDGELYLPASVDRYTVRRTPGRRVWTYAALRAEHGGDGVRAGDVWVLDEEGELVAALEGLVLRRAPGAAPADCLFELAWVPATADRGAMPAPAEIAAALHGHGDELLFAHGVDRYETLRPVLDHACSSYALEAFAALGWTPTTGERVTTDGLAARLAVAPRHRQLFAQILGWLAEDGVLRRDDAGWTVARTARGPAPVLADAERAYPEFANELAFTVRCGARLAGVLRGTTDPLEVLFPGGSLETAEKLYTESAGALAFNGLVRDAVARAVAELPPRRALRVLEIGGGTGGTTTHVAPVLPADRVEYTFTDVSPLFVAKARERFAQLPFLRYGVLDIERDPAAQGFAAGQFDLVLASNVLHATSDLRATLARARGLLAPGGLLVLLEVTRQERWIDLTFGMTDGWWSFRDRDLRPSHALLDRAQWLALLAEFGEPAALETSVPAWNTVFLMRRPAESIGGADVAGDWLILADRPGVGEGLAARLEAAGGACPLRHGDAPPVELRRRWRGVVHLWSLDAPATAALDGPGLASAQRLVCESTLELVRALTDGEPAPIWLVTQGAQAVDSTGSAVAAAQAPLAGLARTLAYEHPELACRYVDLDPAAARPAEAIWDEIAAGRDDDQVAVRGGERHVARIRPLPVVRGEPRVRLTIPQRGMLDNLRIEPARRRSPGPGEVEIRVDVSGVTFRDVLNVLDLYPGDPGPLGGECTGRVERVGAGVADLQPGELVVAVAGGSHDGYVLARRALVAPRPAQLSPEEAVTIPISYLTAAYTLDHLAGLRSGERVLIHAATGGVGLAAVHLARSAGAELFATAGSEAKRDYLRALGVQHVYDSRTTAFAEQVLADTDGAGVDVVLNSLADDFASASFRAIARGGRFLEIGKRGIWTPAQVAALGRDIAYHVVDWGEVADRDPELIGGLLTTIMEAAARGEVVPLPVRTFATTDAVGALRYVAQARHIGKVALRQPGTDVRVVADATYLIAGGFGGLGLRCARWLVARGARHLVLAGRSAPSTAAEREMAALRDAGARVLAVRTDVSRPAEVEALLARAADELPPLRGVINAAGALADGTLRQLGADDFQRVFGPKVDGSWNLHALTRTLPLDFFVLFSSVASVLGAPGQGNHAAANAFEDALAHARRAEGLPAVSINWGAWSELGAAVRDDLEQRRAKLGVESLSPAEALALLEQVLRDNPPQVAAARIDWRRFAAHAPARIDWLGGVLQERASESEPRVAPARTASLTERLAEAPEAQRAELLREHLEGTARTVLGFAAGRRIDPEQPLQELGLDSLMAVEFRNALAGAVGRSLPATLLFSYPALDDIAAFLGRDVFGWTPPAAAASVPSAVAAPGDGVLGAIEDMSDEEVERLFAQQLGGRAP